MIVSTSDTVVDARTGVGVVVATSVKMVLDVTMGVAAVMAKVLLAVLVRVVVEKMATRQTHVTACRYTAGEQEGFPFLMAIWLRWGFCLCSSACSAGAAANTSRFCDPGRIDSTGMIPADAAIVVVWVV